ncbi:MAG TPA: peroxiredoxin [Rhodoblastus sp.]|nr:peroxiredoxin [Rhodoblastus sp.]
MARLVLGILVGLVISTTAWAAMRIGDRAPDFSLPAAVGGKTFTFHLAEALKKGPVVLYFYPKSFTAGCTIEAHEFAENAANFAAAGASLIGVSADGIETQIAFSSRECRDKFPVGADADGKVIRAYDAQMLKLGGLGPAMSDRISYVIGPDGKILYVYRDSAPDKHISNTLAAVRKWKADHKP